MNFRRWTSSIFLLGLLFAPFLSAQTTATATQPEHATRQPNSGEEIQWPPNRGFEGTPKKETLAVGTKLDRFGYPGGTFVAPQGTPFNQRSLPAATKTKPYHVYEVVKPIEVDAGPAAPWFGEPGGGIQYELPKSVQELLDSGSLKELPAGTPPN